MPESLFFFLFFLDLPADPSNCWLLLLALLRVFRSGRDFELFYNICAAAFLMRRMNGLMVAEVGCGL